MFRLGPCFILSLALASVAVAADPIPLGSDGCNHTFARAGYPDQVSRCAEPSRTCSDCGYYVGGGCPRRGGPPGPLQGTYGWDYCTGPCGLRHHVALGWCFGCRPKGGTGAYATDGPPVPNPLACKLPPLPNEGRDCGTCAR